MPGTWASTARFVFPGHVIRGAGVVGAGGAAALYCISTRLGPRLLMVSSAYFLPVRPTVTTRMMDADPITMPSMVSRKRTLLARKLSMARCMVSEKTMVVFAEFSVRWKLADWAVVATLLC